MKLRFLLSLGLILLFSGGLRAQYNPVVIGLSFSPGVSWIKAENNNYASEGPSFSYAYGIDVDFFFSPNYAFSTGLEIQHYTGKVSYPDLYSPTGNEADLERVHSTSTYKNIAFHIPTYMKLKTNPIGYNSFFAEFGLSFLFPFRAYETKHSIDEEGNTIDQGEESNMESTNFASVNLLLGAGIELPLSGDTRFQIAFRFLNGISSISNANTYKTDQDGNVSEDEIANGGYANGKKQAYYLKNLSLSLILVF